MEYRAYSVGDDGHFIGFEPLICPGDSEAIAKARSIQTDHDIEVWSGDRLVTVLKANRRQR